MTFAQNDEYSSVPLRSGGIWGSPCAVNCPKKMGAFFSYGDVRLGQGRENSKEFLRKTLVEGWWGLISFFVNFYAVYTDLVALSRANKLGPPVGAPARPQPSVYQGALIPPPPPPAPPPASR